MGAIASRACQRGNVAIRTTEYVGEDPPRARRCTHLLNVSVRSERDAREVVQEKAAPSLAKRVDAGEVAVSLAAKLTTLSPEKQAELADASEATPP